MAQPTPMGGEPITKLGAFHTTHWSVVLAARDQSRPDAAEALANLCSTYWYPLYAFVRRSGSTRHDAEDLTQEFFYCFLRRDSLVNVSPVFFFQAEDGIRYGRVTGVQTCALPI